MKKKHLYFYASALLVLIPLAPLVMVRASPQSEHSAIGREVAIPRHLQDGEEYQVSLQALIAYGQKLFTAMWTSQEGAGRP
ncbi:MAG: hypothetical protein ACRD2G_06775, partial [Terriglobia bacterium]